MLDWGCSSTLPIIAAVPEGGEKRPRGGLVSSPRASRSSLKLADSRELSSKIAPSTG